MAPTRQLARFTLGRDAQNQDRCPGRRLTITVELGPGLTKACWRRNLPTGKLAGASPLTDRWRGAMRSRMPMIAYIAAACLSAVTSVATIIQPQWFELLFDEAPDDGD